MLKTFGVRRRSALKNNEGNTSVFEMLRKFGRSNALSRGDHRLSTTDCDISKEDHECNIDGVDIANSSEGNGDTTPRDGFCATPVSKSLRSTGWKVCRHEFVRGCPFSVRDLGTLCVVCKKRIWNSRWRCICTNCGVKKHDYCISESELIPTAVLRNKHTPDEIGEEPKPRQDKISRQVEELDDCSGDTLASGTTVIHSGHSVQDVPSSKEVNGPSTEAVRITEQQTIAISQQVHHEGGKVLSQRIAVLKSHKENNEQVLVETTSRSEKSVQKATGPTCSPIVRDENVTLYSSTKFMPRKSAASDMAKYMDRVNQFLDKPSEQKSMDDLLKYWIIQQRLFTRFSAGILLDEESFYSVCPEILSRHIALQCQCETVMDPFCGAGSNIIQFTRTCKKVIGIDVDADKIKLAANNAKVYGVQNRIDLKIGDYFDNEEDLKADVVFMSPPWGGPEYINQPVYSLVGMCPDNGGGKKIIEIARKIAPKVVIHLPRNVDKSECVMLAKHFEFKYVKFENNYIGQKLNSTTLYLSNDRLLENLPKNEHQMEKCAVNSVVYKNSNSFTPPAGQAAGGSGSTGTECNDESIAFSARRNVQSSGGHGRRWADDNRRTKFVRDRDDAVIRARETTKEPASRERNLNGYGRTGFGRDRDGVTPRALDNCTQDSAGRGRNRNGGGYGHSGFGRDRDDASPRARENTRDPSGHGRDRNSGGYGRTGFGRDRDYATSRARDNCTQDPAGRDRDGGGGYRYRRR